MKKKGEKKGVRAYPVSRGIALFLGAFSALNALASLIGKSAGQEIWWLDFSALEGLAGQWGAPCALLVQAGAVALFAAWAVRPSMRAWRKALTVFMCALLSVIGFSGTLAFWNALSAGGVSALFPVPLSCVLAFVFLALAARAWGMPRARGGGDGPKRAGGAVGTAVAFALAAAAFPLLQVATFGTADYRASSDAVLVPGARLQADGTPSPLLEARLDAAAELVGEGRAAYLVLSGGTDASGVNEAAVMAGYARSRGVADDAIVDDPQASSLSAAIADAVDLSRQRGWDTVSAAVSFFQAPRVKMLFLARGSDVLTVPVFGGLDAQGALESLVREVPAWWGSWFACYFG